MELELGDARDVLHAGAHEGELVFAPDDERQRIRSEVERQGNGLRAIPRVLLQGSIAGADSTGRVNATEILPDKPETSVGSVREVPEFSSNLTAPGRDPARRLL